MKMKKLPIAPTPAGSGLPSEIAGKSTARCEPLASKDTDSSGTDTLPRRSSKMKRIAFTSITTNYLPKARVLAHSIKRHSSDVSFALVVAEAFDKSLLRTDDPFDLIITVDDLGIPSLHQWLFTHTVVEACTAIKGHSLVKLLEVPDDTAVLYFDPDIVVTHSLDALFAEFENASTVLTPHGTEPESELRAIVDNEISHLRYGVYNLGFVGVRNTEAGRNFARWWAQRLHDFCYDDIESGIFTDQRWVDLAPAFFEGVKVLRDPCYNVATWNLSHRIVKGSLDRGLRVNGRPLVFYHFSGFDSGAMETMLAAYGKKSPILARFREWYIAECEKMGQSELGARPWRYSTFDNGEPITKIHRRTYRNRRDLQTAFRNPFLAKTSETSFLHWFLRHGSNRSSRLIATGSDYQIVVMAFEEPGDLEGSLSRLLARTANKESLRVASTADVCDRLVTSVPGLQFSEVPDDVASGERRESWLLSQIADCATRGLILVQLGLEVPELWDLRLQWGARREPSVVTAVPLYDGVPMTALLTPGSANNNSSSDEIDRIVCNLDNRHPLEAPSFLYECFYIDTALARPILEDLSCADLDTKREADLSGFSRKCVMSGLSHVILNDIYVGVNPILGHRPLISRRRCSNVELYEHRNTLSEVRARYSEIIDGEAPEFPTVAQRASRRHLHISHSWGGGLGHWIRSYCMSDTDHINMVLRPVGGTGAYGSELELYSDIDASSPIARWALPIPIKATVPGSLAYRHIIESIVSDYGIDAVFVSTLIGHSMDVFTTGAPTLFICHDFFPLTPEIYLRSRHLSGNRIVNFSVDEVYTHGPVALFPNFSPAEATAANKAFKEIVARRQVKLVAPSPSTRQLYLDLVPGLHPDDISVIPHGTVASLLAESRIPYATEGKLRIVIPGRVAPEKGSALLANLLPKMTEFADVLLLGSGIEGQYLADIQGVQVISRYQPEDLHRILAEFQPHLGVLLSDFPETFSYTLDELLALGIPPVAVRIGSFADRIREGENGFLAENDPASVIKLLQDLDRNRTPLGSVRRVLEAAIPRTEVDMIRDYESLLDLPRFSARATHAKISLPPSTYSYVTPEMDAQLSPVKATGTVVASNSETFIEIGSEPMSPLLPATFRKRASRRRSRLDPRKYLDLITRIRQTVDAHIPRNAILAIVSKGDEQLLQLKGRRACHFPQARGGVYAGHHPANSGDAIAHIEALRSRGVKYLLFPNTAMWWFNHYREFKQYLDKTYREHFRDNDTCVIYSLDAPARSNEGSASESVLAPTH